MAQRLELPTNPNLVAQAPEVLRTGSGQLLLVLAVPRGQQLHLQLAVLLASCFLSSRSSNGSTVLSAVATREPASDGKSGSGEQRLSELGMLSTVHEATCCARSGR